MCFLQNLARKCINWIDLFKFTIREFILNIWLNVCLTLGLTKFEPMLIFLEMYVFSSPSKLVAKLLLANDIFAFEKHHVVWHNIKLSFTSFILYFICNFHEHIFPISFIGQRSPVERSLNQPLSRLKKFPSPVNTAVEANSNHAL